MWMKRVRGVESATGQVTDLCIYSFCSAEVWSINIAKMLVKTDWMDNLTEYECKVKAVDAYVQETNAFKC